MPQELEVWYLLPSLRKSLAKIFIIDYKLSQKRASELLGVTEAAISQYVKSKRGREIKFLKEENEDIKKTADKIIKNPEDMAVYVYQLSKKLMGSKSMCEIHKKYDSVPFNCKMCKNSKKIEKK